jgi:hypothetical protein
MVSSSQQESKSNPLISQDLSHRIIAYLQESARDGAQFYVQKPVRGITAVRFNPSQLNSRERFRLIQYFLATEREGNRIYIKKPNDKLKRVSFLEGDQQKAQKIMSVNPLI